MPTYSPADDAFIASVNLRHVRLRGSLALKYHPPDTWCGQLCQRGDSDNFKSHPCGLGRSHTDEHEWSSECGGSRFKRGHGET